MEVVYKSVSLLANSVKLPGFILSSSSVVLLDKTIVSSKIYQSNFFLWSFYLFISDVVKHMLQ